MYTILGFEPFTTQDGKSGYCYYCAKECETGLKPAFNVYTKSIVTGVNVGDTVIPDVQSTKEGKIFVKGFLNV